MVRIAAAVGVVVLAVVLFLVLRPDDEPASPTGTASFVIDVPAGGPSSIEKLSAAEGQHVVITVTSAQPGIIHVHGYNLIEEVGPDTQARFDFTADKPGVFEIEDHGIDKQIAELTVEP
jgi:hypothetical protein